MVAALAAAPGAKASEIYGSIAIDGPSVPVTIAHSGDNETLSFNSPQENQKIFLQISNGSVGSTFSIRDPGGHTLSSQFINHSGIFDTMKLGAPGTYSIYVDPSGTNTGSVTLTLFGVPDNVTGTIYANAQPVPVTIPHVGQGAWIDFWGSDQERIFLNVSNGSVGSTFTIRDQNQNPLASQFINRSNFFDTRRLGYTGHYWITIDPSGTNTGSVTLTLYSVPEDIVDTISADGQPKPVTISNVGQNARYSFPGSKDERVFLKVTNGSVGSTFAIKQGDTTLGSSFINTSNNIGPVKFNDADTGWVTIDPAGLNTGSVTLTLYEVPPDFTGTITPGGPAVTVPITAPGQNAYLAFAGAPAAQSVRVLASNSTISLWDISLLNPDQSVRASSTSRGLGSFTAINWVTVPGVVPPNNTYMIKVDPRDDKVGNVTIALDGSPASTTPPSITGLADVGEVLMVAPGAWTGNSPALSYQWLRCDSLGGSCVGLFGSTGTTYTVAAADLGSTLRVRETATNNYGSMSVESKQTPIVLSALDQLAFAHRPTLKFDSGELWRPLEVTAFLDEHFQYRTPATHQICDLYNWGGSEPGPCKPMTNSTSDMAANNTDHSYINISGDGPGELGSPTDACWRIQDAIVLRQDCDSGTASAIYYEPGQDSANYRYLDYWWFLRLNDEGGVSWCYICQHDEHEGDWEGVTIALDGGANSGASPIAYVGYAAHEELTWFTPDALAGGTRPDVYSAMGTHASYPDQCSSGCQQPPTSPVGAEASHDGTAGWGNNDDEACANVCLKRLDDEWWTWWNGRWGGNQGEISSRWGWSPQSPGLQPRFVCTESGYTAGDCTRPPGSRVPLAHRRRRLFSPRVCAGWFGVDIAALACDAAKLRYALRNHLMRKPGQLHLAVRGRRSGDAPGIAQVVGQPLHVGENISVTGRASANTVFILDLLARDRYRATFTLRDLRLPADRRAVIKTLIQIASRHGRPALRTGRGWIPAEVRSLR